MRKEEFIAELQYSLEGRLSDSDIREITSDYTDVFENAVTEGKTEEEAAKELGSPGRIARTILEDDELKRKEAAVREAEERARAAEEEVRAARAAEAQARAAEAQAKAAALQKPGIDPKYAPFADRLASMGSRLGAYLVDGLFLVALALVTLFFFIGIVEIFSRTAGHGHNFYPYGLRSASIMIFLTLLIALSCFNFLSAIFIWATNGYTPGKWLFKIRVVKLNGEKITFLEAIARELLIKSIASGMTSGLLNIFSFIWGCVSDVHKTVHDLVADTTVIRDERRR